MSDQTFKNNKNNRGKKAKKELEKLLRTIWLRGLDSNQRPRR
jgi:hypothetical protein